MQRPQLGTKLTCGSCGVRFYDLNKPAAPCPSCATPYKAPPPVMRVSRSPQRRAAPLPVVAPPVIDPEALTADAEAVSDEPEEDNLDGPPADDDLADDAADVTPTMEG
jgi:uncharacterized protein (TIGR02300 family)